MCGRRGRSWVGKISDGVCPVVCMEEAVCRGGSVVSAIG